MIVSFGGSFHDVALEIQLYFDSHDRVVCGYSN